MTIRPDRSRDGSIGWREQSLPSMAAGDRRRLCDLLNADTLDDLVRVAYEEASATSHLSRIMVVGWSFGQPGPWAIFPGMDEDRLPSSELENRALKGRERPSESATQADLFARAQSVGFERMAIVPSRRHLVFEVFWDLGTDRAVELTATPIWPDLEIALCNFARLDQLRELSHIDTLTNVFNRRYFNHRLAEEVARAGRFSRALSLAICDLDRFKFLNDTYGHQAGDVVLRYLAQTLRRSVRTIDIVCRLGGDEFAVLMPDTDAGECATLAERLRLAVASGGFTLGGKEAGQRAIDLRLSVGAGVFPHHAERPERLLWCADMALLEAKRAGGNRFVICDPAQNLRGSAQSS